MIVSSLCGTTYQSHIQEMNDNQGLLYDDTETRMSCLRVVGDEGISLSSKERSQDLDEIDKIMNKIRVPTHNSFNDVDAASFESIVSSKSSMKTEQSTNPLIMTTISFDERSGVNNTSEEFASPTDQSQRSLFGNTIMSSHSTSLIATTGKFLNRLALFFGRRKYATLAEKDVAETQMSLVNTQEQETPTRDTTHELLFTFTNEAVQGEP